MNHSALLPERHRSKAITLYDFPLTLNPSWKLCDIEITRIITRTLNYKPVPMTVIIAVCISH
jgi:hypothetical protein